jgi:hypothetical protein
MKDQTSLGVIFEGRVDALYHLLAPAFVDKKRTQAAMMAAATTVKIWLMHVRLYMMYEHLEFGCLAYHFCLPTCLYQCSSFTISSHCSNIVCYA